MLCMSFLQVDRDVELAHIEADREIAEQLDLDMALKVGQLHKQTLDVTNINQCCHTCLYTIRCCLQPCPVTTSISRTAGQVMEQLCNPQAWHQLVGHQPEADNTTDTTNHILHLHLACTSGSGERGEGCF